MRRSRKNLGYTITPDAEAVTKGERLRDAGFPSAIQAAELQDAPHGDHGQNTEAQKRYSRQ
jgi:hypothetical protein